MNTARVQKLTELMPQYDLDCVAIIPGYTMRYLTGLDFHLTERPIMAFFTPDNLPILLAPEFECTVIDDPSEWRLFPWRDEDGADGAFEACCHTLNLSGRRIGAESLSLRFNEYSLISNFAPASSVVPVDSLITSMRISKDAIEIAQIKEAIVLAEDVLDATLGKIRVGMTEKEVAAELLMGLLKAGTEAVPFGPLVQAGVNSAKPHASAGNRELANGDLLIIDFGARVNGYVSDITRTFAVGKLDEQANQIYELVKRSNEAGRLAAEPGVACQDVDRASRKVINDGQFGQYFIHRTGHGIGLEGHEPPFMVEGDTTLLQPGMTFTVEPGIYIPDLGGVRIEDNVLITENGAVSLTKFSRELISVG